MSKSINAGKQEATFRENLEFEKVPLMKFYSWIEDFGESMHRFNVHTGFKMKHYNPKYEVIQGISHSQDASAYDQALEKQAEDEAEALDRLDQIDG